MGRGGKTALVLEGGAMRGLFTCGVLDVFMEQGITFDGIAGISAGAIAGSNFKSGQSGRVIRYNVRYAQDPRYAGLRSLIRTGDYFGADFCYHILPEQLDIFDRETFARNPMDFFVGATDIHTGKCVYHNCLKGDRTDFEWIRASASMPMFSRPVPLDGMELMDGGIASSVPYQVMRDHGYARCLLVLTQPRGYRKKQTLGLPLIRGAMRRYPALVQAMAERYVMYNRQMQEIDEEESAGRMLAIRPPEDLNIRRTERRPKVLERVYRTGRQTGEKHLDDVRRFLT